ncbi:MAG: SAM-dependent chlorinase/fluorinase [Thermodesulfovibrionales bacterium]|nr:SAM-dependent chlorinase/fluorinase [Thermodesulfovibrionales bacterium]
MKNEIKPSGIITLTTDFGSKDSFIGQMKGVILSINHKALIVDITHKITPFSIKEGAYILSSFYKYYPKGTIHIAIVDPGVGSQRRGLLINCNGHFFIGPDNGLFTPLIQSGKVELIIDLKAKHYFNQSISPTFHGRDVFAPVAAWLSKGEPLDNFGDVIDNINMIHLQKPVISENKIVGTVNHIDNFGNVITNITEDMIANKDFVVTIKGHDVSPVSYYEQARGRGLSCLINSSGHLELFIYQDSCKDFLDISEDDKIIVRY